MTTNESRLAAKGILNWIRSRAESVLEHLPIDAWLYTSVEWGNYPLLFDKLTKELEAEKPSLPDVYEIVANLLIASAILGESTHYSPEAVRELKAKAAKIAQAGNSTKAAKKLAELTPVVKEARVSLGLKPVYSESCAKAVQDVLRARGGKPPGIGRIRAALKKAVDK
jgi:D-mannonate dehydratase